MHLTPSRHRTLVHAALALAFSSVAAPAAAHFVLEEPENWVEQNGLGDPQKTGPCGDEGPMRPTGAITAYRTGQTITIRIDETIYHPGHFRVALATSDRSELPPMPEVTPDSRSDCGSVPIMDPPVFPVLADGVLPHTSPLTGVQEFEVTLPDGVTCDHCTLQVVQWMRDHGAPCFYYHCADLSISEVVVDSGPAEESDAGSEPVDAASAERDASSASIDASTPSRTDAGPSSTSSGCACSARGTDDGARGLGALALAGLAAITRRRRRR